jgi:hypothetical protein
MAFIIFLASASSALAAEDAAIPTIKAKASPVLANGI